MCITNNCTILGNKQNTHLLFDPGVSAGKTVVFLAEKTHVDDVVNQQLLCDQVYGRDWSTTSMRANLVDARVHRSRRARAKPDEPEREKTKPEYKEDQTWATRVVRVRGKNDE